MKRVLYLTAMIVPYRTRFFNLWAEACDLTVAYEYGGSGVKNKEWLASEKLRHKALFLDDAGGKVSPYLRLMKLIRGDWDVVVVGCCNMGMERWLTLYLRFMRIPYVLNFDGESFFEGNSLKSRIKRWFVKGASCYLIAGEKSKSNLQKIVKGQVTSYYFSPLYEKEIGSFPFGVPKRESFVLVVGQYFPYKGMDVMLKIALKDQSIKYKFVGMGVRQDLCLKDFGISEVPNIEFIPFLQKEELEEEYKKCALFVLPSRQECWGLVINEAASFGAPIVSTWGSGAAVEFLQDDYPQYLAKPKDEDSLYEAIKLCLSKPSEEYSKFLISKARQYTIERMVKVHSEMLDI